MRYGIVMMAGGLAAMACPVAAAASDPTSYRAIASGDLQLAASRLEAERMAHPDRPEVLLNLAAVYLYTGRTAEAHALYDAVMTAPAVDLDLPSGAGISSHAVAARGLALMEQRRIVASR